MTNSILLLKIIESQGRLTLLQERGLSYSQVAMMINEHQSNGNVTLTEDGISLTEQGKQLLRNELAENTIKSKDSWIVKQEHYYREPISQKKIVLPKSKNI